MHVHKRATAHQTDMASGLPTLIAVNHVTTEDTAVMTNDGGHGLLHGKTTNSILASSFKVHSRLGPGLLESAYKACLIHELARCGCKTETEKLLPVMYEGIDLGVAYRLDLVVDDVVIVEVKASETILPVHEAQLLSYLRLSGKRVGLLINFNVAHLKDGIRRRIL